jgi:hypothetical protein
MSNSSGSLAASALTLIVSYTKKEKTLSHIDIE